MFITDNVAAEGFSYRIEDDASTAAYERLMSALNKEQRRLFIRFYDSMCDCLTVNAQDNYVRGICMGLSFAERYCYRPK